MYQGDMTSRDDGSAQVRDMFARIARRYDLNNHLHSLGLDMAWRRAAANAANVGPGAQALDVACGTGDLTRMLARRGATVTGVDFCPQMLEIAKRKLASLDVRLIEADARSLPFDEASFDAVTIAFGIRNIPQPADALAEFHRVLRPGGRLIVLEFHPDAKGVLGRCLGWFVGTIMSRTGGWISGDRQGAYDYLHKSVQSFMSAADLAGALRHGGFADVSTRTLFPPLAAVHRGMRT